ncbi:MAG: hypothetical protein JSV86_02385 [Gemmatimonadota bacterium]|nr:MAG: hypothetical protein JSV86_02385 [Gemmatimonadota bacterium]
MAEYSGVARDMGITEDEIDAVQSIVMAVAGGRVRATFREAQLRAVEKRKTKSGRSSY